MHQPLKKDDTFKSISFSLKYIQAVISLPRVVIISLQMVFANMHRSCKLQGFQRANIEAMDKAQHTFTAVHYYYEIEEEKAITVYT